MRENNAFRLDGKAFLWNATLCSRQIDVMVMDRESWGRGGKGALTTSAKMFCNDGSGTSL